jgi:hypothetical protein
MAHQLGIALLTVSTKHQSLLGDVRLPSLPLKEDLRMGLTRNLIIQPY